MIQFPGGEDVFGKVRTPSFRVSPKDVIAAAPDILLVACCGYDADQARKECQCLPLPKAWDDIPAVREDRVYALEANSYFSRPGPRLITGIETLAKVFPPEVEATPEAANAPPT